MEERQEKTKISQGRLKRTILIAVLVILGIWYFYLRIQEWKTISFQQTVSATQEIPYILAGSTGEVRYDNNGNLIDTSDFLVSVSNYREVLPSSARFSFKDIPAYRGKAVVTVNDNVPFFTPAEIILAKQGHFEYYGNLDALGRCTVAFDCLGRETMPNGLKRGSISAIRPTGWKQARYDCVDSETVMTRAHLAGYMLSAENANGNNLITHPC